MRLLGVLLVLGGAAGGFFLRRRQDMLPLQIGQALLGDLAVLRHQICVRRAPLPLILEQELRDGAGAEALWRPLARDLERDALPRCWERAVAALPQPLERVLGPLGPLLPVGGEELEQAIEETREELTRVLRAERERQDMAGRLTAAVCLSGACLLILVLI